MKRRIFVTNHGTEVVAYKTPKGVLMFEVDPDAYMDIVNMPLSIDVSFGVQIYNYTAMTLWFTAKGSGAGWSWASAKQLGSIGPGSNKIFNIKSLGTRSKPSNAVDDDITITFNAYSDSGYTNQVGGDYNINITYHWIDSIGMTLLDLDDFDDGTLEGWSIEAHWSSFAINTSYVLSPPNSALAQKNYTGSIEDTAILRKTFNVPSCSEAFLIVNFKFGVYDNPPYPQDFWVKEVQIRKETSIIVRTGNDPHIIKRHAAGTQYTNWFRMVAPMTPNESASYKIAVPYRIYGDYWIRMWLDDIKAVYQ